jgi:hypothetical protein
MKEFVKENMQTRCNKEHKSIIYDSIGSLNETNNKTYLWRDIIFNNNIVTDKIHSIFFISPTLCFWLQRTIYILHIHLKKNIFNKKILNIELS